MIKSSFIFKIIFFVFISLTSFFLHNNSFAYEKLRDIDRGTFNEYRYYITEGFLSLKKHFEVNEEISRDIADSILKNAKIGYKYLPDNLKNKNYLNDLAIAVEKGINEPRSDVNYGSISKRILNFLDKTDIQTLEGKIEATPISGNAPLNITLKRKIIDPSGTVIPKNNYVWWIDVNGNKQVIGRGPIINYTFGDEGNFVVFLDVKSSHKNESGYTDVLPFFGKVVIEVKEKIASLIIKVNNVSLKGIDEIKFSPEEANYGLIIDATSSTPSSGTKFLKTEWDFGNGIKKEYDGPPKIERVVYGKEGKYEVKLKLTTNENKIITRNFNLIINKPVATIVSNLDSGYIGDKFTFNTRTLTNNKNLEISWKIIDIDNDKVLFEKSRSSFTYTFSQKGKFNIQLQVKDAAGNVDNDSKIIYINSRPPVADFDLSIKETSKPNRVLLDGTKSFDPDFSDMGKLKYVWTINGEIVNLESANKDNSLGYYVFDRLGEQNIALEVTDPDQISSTKTSKITINSLLSVDFTVVPRATQRGKIMRFIAISENAKYYEWNFGDGSPIVSGLNSKVNHKFEKSGIFNVKLKVRDISGNTNEISKVVYVGNRDYPLAVIDVNFGTNEKPIFDSKACENGAYIVDRVKTVYFDGSESVDIEGDNSGLTYSWKIGNDKYLNGKKVSIKFDELGCFPVKLVVSDNINKKQDSEQIWVKVQNIKPTVKSIDISVQNPEQDPVVVNLQAIGAKDEDGVIQSYLWYYYTDSDNEPQDFRITNVPNTTFVIPKITDTFYFVVVVKDDNGERFSTDERESTKYSLSLAGDNINTPLIDFSVNKNNILLGEEVIFTVKVKNILGQDISKNSDFAFDFDGDGFYDIEGNKDGSINYEYKNSGEFFAKVRVKHKGMTNTRKIKMNVENVLTPDFDYISIGNKYLFVNKTKGKFDNITWNLGGEETIKNKNYFLYEFKNGKSKNTVTLKVSEGTKVSNIKKDVIKNVKNFVNFKKTKGIKIISIPEIEEDKIVVEDKNEKVYVYVGETKINNLKNYGIDFDISVDSDLNGGKDDDIDNKNHPSFNDGSVVEIPLNSSKKQIFRIFLLDKNEEVIESKDIEIIKSYLDEEEEINPDNIVFNGITENEKIKIEKLKSYIKNLPKQYRLTGMQFIQKLQEEWFYDAERTKVIIDFEEFIMQIDDPSSKEIRELLESFLVEGQEDNSVRNMAYNVIKNLIPKTIENYDDIISNLDLIKASPEKLEENKVFGKEILEFIKDSPLIENEDKMTIKSQLQVLIYGSIENIPQEVKEEVGKKQENKLFGLIYTIISVLKWILIVIIGIIFIFFILYILLNKNKNLGFQDFIIDFTSGKGNYKLSKKETNNNSNDILNDLSKEQETSKKDDKIEQKIDFSQNKTDKKVKIPDFLVKAQESVENKKNEENKSISKNMDFDEGKKYKKENKIDFQDNKDMKSTDDVKIPDFLKGSFGKENKRLKKEAFQNEHTGKIDNNLEEKLPDLLKNDASKLNNKSKKQDFKSDDISKFNDDIEEKIPDWLKGSFDSDEKTEDKASDSIKNDLFEEEKTENKKTNNAKNKDKKNIIENTKTKIENDNVIEEEKIPDWLKTNSLEDNKSNDFQTKGNKKPNENLQDELPDWLKNDVLKKDENEILKNQEDNKSTDKIEEEFLDGLDKRSVLVDNKKELEEKQQEKTVDGLNKQEDILREEVLLDGKNSEQENKKYDVPDWLKDNVFEKDDNSEEKIFNLPESKDIFHENTLLEENDSFLNKNEENNFDFEDNDKKIKENTKYDNENQDIPDWLKGNPILEEETQKNLDKEKETKKEKKKNIKNDKVKNDEDDSLSNSSLKGDKKSKTSSDDFWTLKNYDFDDKN